MPIRTPDCEALREAINSHRKLMLSATADLCDDQGLTEEAAGWRWLAENNKWPQYSDMYGWDWHSGRDPSELPREACFSMPGWDVVSVRTAYSGSEFDALEAAAVAVGKWLSRMTQGENK